MDFPAKSPISYKSRLFADLKKSTKSQSTQTLIESFTSPPLDQNFQNVIDENNYKKALTYLNECHKLMNNILNEGLKLENQPTFEIPQLPNFMALFKLMDKFWLKKNQFVNLKRNCDKNVPIIEFVPEIKASMEYKMLEKELNQNRLKLLRNPKHRFGHRLDKMVHKINNDQEELRNISIIEEVETPTGDEDFLNESICSDNYSKFETEDLNYELKETKTITEIIKEEVEKILKETNAKSLKSNLQVETKEIINIPSVSNTKKENEESGMDLPEIVPIPVQKTSSKFHQIIGAKSTGRKVQNRFFFYQKPTPRDSESDDSVILDDEEFNRKQKKMKSKRPPPPDFKVDHRTIEYIAKHHPLKLSARDLNQANRKDLLDIGIFTDNGQLRPEIIAILEQYNKIMKAHQKNANKFRMKRQWEIEYYLKPRVFTSASTLVIREEFTQNSGQKTYQVKKKDNVSLRICHKCMKIHKP